MNDVRDSANGLLRGLCEGGYVWPCIFADGFVVRGVAEIVMRYALILFLALFVVPAGLSQEQGIGDSSVPPSLAANPYAPVVMPAAAYPARHDTSPWASSAARQGGCVGRARCDDEQD